MKPSIAASCLLATLLASLTHAHPDTPAVPSPTPTSTGSGLDDLIPSATPFPAYRHHASPPNLELRQNLGQDPNAGAIPGQVPPVTVYSIISQVGATGVGETYTYTQTFAAVLDQFPLARRGSIGYGTLHPKRGVDAQPTPSYNTGYIAQPLVIAMETVFITRPLRRVTDIIIVETFTITANGSANGTIPYYGNATYPGNGTIPYVGGWNRTNATFPNATSPAPANNGTALSGWNSSLPTVSLGTGYGYANGTLLARPST